jgi:hypothetical protein
MLISSDASGGQVVSTQGAPRFYDDVGCLAADAPSENAGTRAYVRTATGAWIAAAAAAYAQPAGAHTPMGSGLVAFDTVEQARAADRAGRALSWQDVVTRETSEARR